MKPKELSPVVLAFLGDAVHTLYVRQSVLVQKILTVNNYNQYCSRLCSAISQAKVLDKIFDLLTEEEKDIVRRGRNAKTKNIAKNSSIEEYKKATGFEALIGWLQIQQKKERLDEILELSVQEL